MQQHSANPHVFITIMLCFVALAAGELRWCKIANSTLSPAEDNWIQYNDTIQTCLKCSDVSTMLIDVERIGRYECCEGILVNAGVCGAHLKESGQDCAKTTRCDGKKQCVEGYDEVGCHMCNGTDQFSCQTEDSLLDSNSASCVKQNQVCDSRKDCRFGLDETGCQWHEGWCTGFLCKMPHARCIPLSQVCDGTKQCIDGSDEFNCQYCDNQFRCRVFQRNNTRAIRPGNTETAQCIGRHRVCDGESDCDNNLDEMNCYRWKEWSSWSVCNPPDVCNRTRTRTCIDGKTSAEVSALKCLDVEDYHGSEGTVLLESQNETFPTQPVPTTLDTTTGLPVSIFSTTATQNSNTPTTEFTTKVSEDRSTVSTQREVEVISSTEQASTTLTSQTTLTSNRNTVKTSSHEYKSATLVLTTMTEESKNATDHKNSSDYGMTDEIASNTVAQEMEPRGPSSAALAIIIAATIVAGSLLLTMICCLVFCFTEKRYRTGKWTPRKLRKNRKIKVPDMYYDIPIEDGGTMKRNLPENQKPKESHVMSTFSGLHNMSAIDSGIDANSTSSCEAELHERHLTTNFLTSPFPQRKKIQHITVDENEFPPPPPHITS